MDIASRVEQQGGFGMGPARFVVKACWEATWEPEDGWCRDNAHQRLVDECRTRHLEISPRKLLASNIDQQQPEKLQQGLDAKQAVCNGYHAGLKKHVSIDPIHPDLDFCSTGQAVIQCEMISDYYARDDGNEIQVSM